MTETIYLVRHGRTALNAQGRFRGRADPPLDARGSVEAADTGQRLASAEPATIYSSPLLRAVQTARMLAGPVAARIRIEDDLTDLDHGSWTGLTPREAELRDPDAYRLFRTSPRDAHPPGGERMADVEHRMLRTLRRIGRGRDRCAAVVSHEIPIRLVIASLPGVSSDRFWDVPLPTASFVEIRRTNRGLELVREERPTSPVTWFCMGCYAQIPAGAATCPSCGRAIDEDRWSYERKVIAALDHRLADRRVIAARILGELRSRSAIPRLVELATGGDDPVLAADAAASLAVIDPDHPTVAELRRTGPVLVRAALERKGDAAAPRRP